MKIFQLAIIVALLLTSCTTQKRVSTIVGGDYNKQKDVTEYFVFPFGSTALPGKWEKEDYDSGSKQQFFKNDEKISIAIAFMPIGNFEFNTDKSKTGYEFVKAYNQWESEYYSKKYKFNVEILETDENRHFIISRFYGEAENIEYDTYFLFGEKNENASNFSISVTDKWTKEQKIATLKAMFNR